ncbi:TPA: hypothetical protein N0F65_005452 [Lagenidium giganteum]|uniref:Uncharacterized protein n=1 Tax=Lagenidium giganteum TaxID=4803 RepID=A0AAV2Z3E4_9STRA|nr:TPA: hypothetical protein N0F65_005452 [Lagenidium giganteum]
MAPTQTQLSALFAGGNAAALLKPQPKRRGRKPTAKPAKIKPKRPPPSATQARLREYERRSRNKRENTIVMMKEVVQMLEQQLTVYARHDFDHPIQRSMSDVAVECMQLENENFHLRKAVDDHKFFHTMVQIECDYRETSDPVLPDFTPTAPWKPVAPADCLKVMKQAHDEIEAFSNSENFISSGLEICGWREKRKLCGHSVKFLFHKRFPTKECSEAFSKRSFQMRAFQDQATSYFGPFLDVHVEVIQRVSDDIVVVRRKITHTVDLWVHHAIYLLFRIETEDGYVVCIRDINPADAEPTNLSAAAANGSPVIWATCFVWWKFTKITDPGATGFEVEYGGALGSATEADATFWMREVLLLALRWESLAIGPLITL